MNTKQEVKSDKIIPHNLYTLHHGDCVQIMKNLAPSLSIDLIVTDPPYLARYRDRNNRTLEGDIKGDWMLPAFQQMYRLLKLNSFLVSFYGWHQVEKFMTVWKRSGFRPVGHIVWQKSYASRTSFLQARHEQAYLLIKGNPPMPKYPIQDVRSWVYSGNKHHPTEKHPFILEPLISAFSKMGDVVLDPFAGSGSTAIACMATKRRFIGIEKDQQYFDIAKRRLEEEFAL